MNNEDKSRPENIDIVRTWKDEEYRNSLTPEQLASIPPNPAGELSEEELEELSGGLGIKRYTTEPCPYFTDDCLKKQR